MSLRRLVGIGALTLYAGIAGANSLSAYQEYHRQRELIFKEFVSEHVKEKGDLGIRPALENITRTVDYVPNGSYLLAVNVGFPTSFVAGLGALYLLFRRKKEEE